MIHVKALRFCFYASLQEDLDDKKEYWNNHKTRKSDAAEIPDGWPELNCLSKDYGDNESKGTMCLSDLSTVIIDLQYFSKLQFVLFNGFVKLAMAVMSENNLLWPSNHDESETLL